MCQSDLHFGGIFYIIIIIFIYCCNYPFISDLHFGAPSSDVTFSQRPSLGAGTDGTIRALCDEERSLQFVHRVERSLYPKRKI